MLKIQPFSYPRDKESPMTMGISTTFNSAEFFFHASFPNCGGGSAVVFQVSNEKKNWLFGVYRGLYYPVMWGL